MQILHSLPGLITPTLITVGSFEGVHCHHNFNAELPPTSASPTTALN